MAVDQPFAAKKRAQARLSGRPRVHVPVRISFDQPQAIVHERPMMVAQPTGI